MADQSSNIVQFSVAYNLGEYRRFVLDHLDTMSGRAEIKGAKANRLVRFCVGIAVVLPFMMKKRRMPICDFRIDGQEIRRTTSDGVLVTKWTDVVAIRRYSAGYLVEKKKAALPIPYRCLDRAQREILDALFTAREAQLAAAAKANPLQ